MRKFDHDIDLNDGRVYVIKFFATWCGPCKLYAPVFERAERRHPTLEFYEADVDQGPVYKAEYDFKIVPTTVVIKDGEVVAKHSGVISSRLLDELLGVVLSSPHANST